MRFIVLKFILKFGCDRLGEGKRALEIGRKVSHLHLASEKQRARWRWQ